MQIGLIVQLLDVAIANYLRLCNAGRRFLCYGTRMEAKRGAESNVHQWRTLPLLRDSYIRIPKGRTI